MATPLVRIPQPSGGTMYAFASSARDMTRAFNNPDINFEFSQYALLDLPDFTESVNSLNTIDFGLNLINADGVAYEPSLPNIDFAQTFQNYVLNAEELLLKNTDYDPVIFQSDAEKLFFKWLTALGAIRFRSADSNESTVGAFVEDSIQENSNYTKVVKYIGTIDAENDIAYKGNAYHEVYINVPTSVGKTPTVLFQPKQYNTNATKLYVDDVIEGRSGQIHPDPNLNLIPVVDVLKKTFTVTVQTVISGNVYFLNGQEKPELDLVRGGVYTFDQSDSSNTNHPLLIRDVNDNSFTDGVEAIGIPGESGAKTVFTVPLDAPDDLRYYCTVHGNGMGNTITVEDNKEPFYNIDPNITNSVQIAFNASIYSQIINNSEVKSILDFSKTGQQFTFNAILVYYDLYSSSNPSRRATNLYGILILDEIKTEGGLGSKIKEQIKFKSNEVTGLNGNAFSLKLNLKFNSSLDNVGVETSVNDFTTFSMDLFMDTTTAIENATEILIEANRRHIFLAERLDILENLVVGSEDSEDLVARITEVEEQMQNASLQLQNSESLLQLITKAHDRINSMIDGTIPTEIQYNTDVIFAGAGTKIDKSNPEKIKIINNVNGYSMPLAFKWDLASTPSLITASNPFDLGFSGQGAQAFGIYTKLLTYTNRLSLQNLLTNEPNDNLDIYIDDSSFAWKAGQIFKISFDTINMANNSIRIFTSKTTNYKVNIAVIKPSNLILNKPYIELICIDPNNYIFEIDVFENYTTEDVLTGGGTTGGGTTGGGTTGGGTTGGGTTGGGTTGY